MSVQVSIIIPVYNAEVFLHRCIHSILRQTFTNWELILIDDGSPDNSGSICDDYAQKDRRIKVIHKKNGGVSSARNAGLKVAQSEWICFVDADDYIAPNYLEIVKSSNADLIILSAQYIGVNGCLLKHREKLKKIVSHNKISKDQIIKDNLDSVLFKTPWGKIFKKKCIKDILFNQDIWIGEDTLFLYQYLNNINSIEINPNYIYYWQTSDESTTLKYQLTPKQAIDILEKLFYAYSRLNIKSPKGEWSIVSYYFRIMDKSSSYQQLGYWYNSKIIKNLNPLIQENLSSFDYFKYKLQRYPLLNNIILNLITILCSIKQQFKNEQ